MKRTAVLILLIAFAFLCGCSSSSSDGLNRNSAGTEDNPDLSTNLIAGSGQGWPGTGTDVGSVDIWDDGTNLYVKYTVDAPWYFALSEGDEENLHLYISDSTPPNAAPGQFQFKAYADGTSYIFERPLVGVYPANGHEDPVPYDWTGDELYIMAHADVCSDEGGEGGTDPEQGMFEMFGLYAGATDTLVGWVTLSMDGSDVLIRIETVYPYTLAETQAYLGLFPPPTHSPGQWKSIPGAWGEEHSPLPGGTTVDTFSASLSDIGATFGDTVYIAVHATVDTLDPEQGEGGQSATAWKEDCRTTFPDLPQDHWKSYCSFVVPADSGTGGGGDDGGCETAWGIDPVNGENGASGDEPGWFPTFFNYVVKKWGWVIRYQL